MLGDLGVILAAAVTAEFYYFGMASVDESPKIAYVVIPTYLIAAWSFDAYHLSTLRIASASVQSALSCLAAATGLSLLAALAFKVISNFSWEETLLFLSLAAVGLTALRWTVAAGLLRKSDQTEARVVLLGDESVRSNRDRKVAATINVRACDWRPVETDPNFLNDLSVAVAGADRIVLSFQAVKERQEWARLLGQIGLETELLEPGLADLKPLALRYLDSTPTLVVSTEPLTLRKRALKRAFDLTFVLLAAPVIVPLVAVLAILIRLDSPGPAFFLQKRIGTNNRYFNCIKFRTMRVDVTDAAGCRLTERNDPRVTRLGHFLRHTSLDELPQLWNVFKGEMSLVGPRPHALGASAGGALYWEVVPAYWQRHSMKPGLTGLAQIRGYRGPTEKRSDIESRVAADLEYIRTWSLWLDMRILFRTFHVLVHSNAF
ncbi:exopolysaccharide biosynthesis polyprenyl glycosylphosphotransferase [Ensifer sp. BR816]|uniref:exopolysaccharide biosynthesis polyprenyl glycosylphosphotransferase n=1 Tax=Rhizobium sp. (strain BR816) TaxID=1057002 RepID=UPI0012FA937A|nr:exopolysaccharide biosynthesis polyprenyl glycosylphosphotransferase [Ensifer sp. BR816]